MPERRTVRRSVVINAMEIIMQDEWYHQLINNAIHRPYAQSTRNFLACRLRVARRDTSKAAVRNLTWDVARVAWPIKLRPNGRYR